MFAAASDDTFRVAHFSVQSDHVHVIVEAADKATLSSHLRSVIIRIALRLNKLLGRVVGKVWADRCHRRDLSTPREVRNALVYVLFNFKKHLALGDTLEVVDPFSSAPWFDGWDGGPLRGFALGRSPVVSPRTWLLSTGWRRHGPLRLGEAPAHG